MHLGLIYCPLYEVGVGVHCGGVLNVWKSVEKQSGPESLSIISQVSAVEGCPLSGVLLYK